MLKDFGVIREEDFSSKIKLFTLKFEIIFTIYIVI